MIGEIPDFYGKDAEKKKHTEMKSYRKRIPYITKSFY